IVLYALTTLEFSVPMARRTVLLLASFPASFFFLSPYSESLFLLASLLCFWSARRGQWGAAGAAGVVSSATRSVGILLLPALVLISLALRWKLLAPPYLVYVVASLLVILSYPLPARPLLSAPRFCIVLFPTFWAMAALFTGRRWAVALIAFVVGFSLLAIAFMNRGFIFCNASSAPTSCRCLCYHP